MQSKQQFPAYRKPTGPYNQTDQSFTGMFSVSLWVRILQSLLGTFKENMDQQLDLTGSVRSLRHWPTNHVFAKVPCQCQGGDQIGRKEVSVKSKTLAKMCFLESFSTKSVGFPITVLFAWLSLSGLYIFPSLSPSLPPFVFSALLCFLFSSLVFGPYPVALKGYS